ncbi:triose-phosphate transporter family-domain-containing protein [Dendryphion nanum]|uniref:Triose-phosphate transporter family-domain-containing protein n=1 Tax=Dendryphion nanum TaxID=256645 RepID=A0A9P9DGV1_9PLEO|nr:triose-phosphate transporter family-domain-containing protein [Dendryphion nanum]
MSSNSVARWLQDQQQPNKGPLAPDSLHPADAFPLRTFSNPPSDTDSDRDQDDTELARGLDVDRAADVATLIHPPTPSMDEHPPTSHARRRSSSLAGASGPPRKQSKKHRRQRSDHIIEEGEDDSSSGDHSDSDSSEKTDSDDHELDDMSSRDGLEDDEETGLTGRDRRRRRRRKRRNTRLDQRIVEERRFTKEEEKLADQNLLHSMLINVVLIGLWYLFSISISVYNKWMFKQDKGDGKTEHIFPFPLFTTCLHMIVQFSLSSLVLLLIPSFRPRHDSLNSHDSHPREPIDPKKPLMTRWFYISRIGPCGVATGMDIGLGNTSLKFISLTFFTMCKSSALGFVLIFAFLFRLEKPSWRLVFIIMIMTVGVIMMVAGETAFHVLGFVLVMASACSSGFRWSLTQILLLRNPATANPFSSIFFLAPVMFVSLFILAVPVEGFSALSEGLHNLFEAKGTALGVGILLFPGVLAFLMTSSEFALLKRTSVVTLSICGIFKEVVTITTANLVFHDPLTPVNITGLIVTIGSIAAYNYMKISKMREDARMKAHIQAQDEYAPVSTRDPDHIGTSATGSSTRNILRDGLSLAPGVSSDRPAMDSPTRAAPVKRPEDLE